MSLFSVESAGDVSGLSDLTPLPAVPHEVSSTAVKSIANILNSFLYFKCDNFMLQRMLKFNSVFTWFECR